MSSEDPPSTTADDDRDEPAPITIRAATIADRDAIIDLLVTQMGWPAATAHEWFSWKHLDSPAGPSPTQVADMDGRIVGLRTFMRTPWITADGEHTIGVRAVDTVTHPDARGRGIFRSMTLAALDSFAVGEVTFVYNTPNDQSRPGYLKMGWVDLGRPTIWVRPRTPADLLALARSQEAASLESLDIDLGDDAASAIRSLAGHQAPRRAGRWYVDTSPEYLEWRYGFQRLHYRVLPTPGGDGGLIVRWRTRGESTELVVCDEVGAVDGRSGAKVLGRALHESGATYALCVGSLGRRLGFVPIPRRGPVVTWRPTQGDAPPHLRSVELTMGALELM